jgi:tRNA nucleotidyltransferase (CCA-adding enzyme)
MEVLSAHDNHLNSEEKEYVINKADSLKSERHQLRIGPALWDRLNGLIHDMKLDTVRNNIIAVLSSKPAEEFNSLMKDIMAGNDKGKKTLENIGKDIKNDNNNY